MTGTRPTLHRPAPSLAAGRDPVAFTAADAGWGFCGLQVLRLAAGETRLISTGSTECAVLPLSGGLAVEVEGRRFELAGRDSVFAAVTDWAYLPIDAEVRLSSMHGCEVALPSALASRRFDPAHIAAADVPVEVRGAGPATRQVTNFCAPGVFDGADRLMCVELLTPDGNWSSYPPHKHDGTDGCLVANEEIYYFRIGRTGMIGYDADGFALHRTYTADGEIDENVAVRDGDVFLIPRGFHGPCIAAPGYPLYYLNVLAGPGDERSMAFCDDLSHHWVRGTWDDMPVDPRCPMTGAGGPVVGGPVR
jgi:5-deoxy-glucuronate isomerase